MGGAHSTDNYKENKQNKCVMWVSRQNKRNDGTSESLQKGYHTSIVFTEIDHNYVNPVCNKFKK
jgi:hypothetical protein